MNASGRVAKGRPKNYIPDADIRPLAAAYLKGEPVEGEVVVLTKDQSEAADYNLSPSRWVGRSEGAEVGSVPVLIRELEDLSKQDALITSELLRLLQPLSVKQVD